MLNSLPTLDQELIRLLAQKIRLLAQSKQKADNSTNEGLSADLTHCLTENGIPEFVWNNLMLNCIVASSHPVSPIVQEPRQITIMGGRGKMGGFFAQQLSKAGHCVSTFGREDWYKAPQLLGQAELVIICVPLEQTVTVIEKASYFLDTSTVLVDLASLKTPIVSAMLEHHCGPVLSLHPMFGPGVRSLLAQNVIVCPGRNLEASQWFLDFLSSRGSKLTFCTPNEHDRMMIIVQAIRHFTAFSLGVFLAQENIDIQQTLNFASPLYRFQLNLVSRLFAQNESLSCQIMQATPEHQQAINRLVNISSHLAKVIASDDQEALQQTFAATRSIFEPEVERTLAESNYLINSLSVFLAAQQ